MNIKTTLAILALAVTAAVAAPASETDRMRLVRALIKKRETFARAGQTRRWQACDAEIRRHPTPADGDAAALARALVGAWHSPRHDYAYRADGTWIMLPAGEDGTRGRWRIVGNRLEETSGAETTRYTVILLTEKENVVTDGENVFYRTR